MANILVPFSKPRPFDITATHYRKDVTAPALVWMTDACAHLALAKFRQAAMRQVDWGTPSLGDAPTAGPHNVEVMWLSSPFCEHVALVIGLQSYASSSDPTVTATLIDLDDGGAAVDGDGVVWQASAGTLPEYRQNRGGSYRYHIHYVSTSDRVVEASEVSGETPPRCLNVGALVRGHRLAVQLEAEYARIWSVTVFERLSTTYSQE